jgi:hypothetical protein
VSLCTDSGKPVSIDGFYQAINEATGNTNRSIDDVWKLYITDVLGYEYKGQHPAHYGLKFGDGGLGVPWTLDSAISAPEIFSVKTDAPATTGSSFSRSTVALTSDPETYGDFPTDTTVFGPESFSNTNVGWGQNASGADTIGGLWIAITTPITQLVANATLRIRTTAVVSGSPTFRIHAVNAISPSLPTATVDCALGLYTSPGWTTSYAAQTLAALTTYPIDVTDVINELILNNGTTGTSVLFALYADAAPGVTASFNIAGPSTYLAGLDIVRSLNHRDYQTKTIDGTALWYWPFDASDCGPRGLQEVHRAVVAVEGTGDGRAVTSQSDTAELVPFEFYSRPDKFGSVPRAFPAELDIRPGTGDEANGGYSRQFFGPLVDDTDPAKHNWMYGSDFRPSGSTYDYIFFAQHVVLTNAPAIQYLYDAAGIYGMSLQFTQLSNGDIDCHGSWTGTSDDYASYRAVVSVPATTVPNTVVSLGLWYSSPTNTFTFLYNAGSGWVVGGTWTDTGAVAPQDISGVQFGDYNPTEDSVVCQGWICLELRPTIDLAKATRIMDEMRTLWKAGIKSLPPVLFV